MNRLVIAGSIAALIFTSACTSKFAKLQQNIHSTSQVMVEEAISYADKGKYDGALEILNQAIQFDPKNDNAFVIRSSVFLTQNKLREAIDDANAALSINKRNAYAYVHRAHALLYVNQFDQAIQDCNNALKIDPEFYPAYVHRGTAFYRKGDLRLAIRDLTIALEKMPDDRQKAHPFYVRSLCYEQMGKENLASKDRHESKKTRLQSCRFAILLE